MFLTITIDTHQVKKSKFRVRKVRINPAKGWRKAIHIKKRTLTQKLQDWRKSLSTKVYKMGGQIAMF